MVPNFFVFLIPGVMFGTMGWVMFFIPVYLQFYQMQKEKRILLAIETATVLTIVLLLVAFVFLWFVGVFG